MFSVSCLVASEADVGRWAGEAERVACCALKDAVIEEPVFAGAQRGEAGQFPLLARIAFITGGSIWTILAGIVADYASLGHSVIVVAFVAETTGSCSPIVPANCAISCSPKARFALVLAGSAVICIWHIVEFVDTGAAAISARGSWVRSMGVGYVACQAFCLGCPWAGGACVMAGSAGCWRAVIEVSFDAGAGVVVGEEYPLIGGGAGCALGYSVVTGDAGVVAGQSLAGCFDWVLFYFAVWAVAAAEGGEEAGGITSEATGCGRRGAGLASDIAVLADTICEILTGGAGAVGGGYEKADQQEDQGSHNHWYLLKVNKTSDKAEHCNAIIFHYSFWPRPFPQLFHIQAKHF